MPDASHPTVLFDGVCNACEASVNWIIAHDRRRLFWFAALQSPAGERLLREYGLRPGALVSIVLIQDGRAYKKSGAVLRVFRSLRWPWPLLFGLIAVPAFIRDLVYNFLAGRRYRWLGRKDECMVPTPEVRERFLVE
jgi:predicted DCC family thiol-disulfide oxidoreductase YuxK